MLQYKAGYKFVEGGVHAQVLDFPAAITCGADLSEARRGRGSVKRQDLVRHLLAHGCRLLREGRSHSVWLNPASRAMNE